MKSDINSNLAQRIAYLLDKSGMLQSDAAERIGIERTAFSKIINGTRRVSADELSSLSDLFGVTTDYLLGRKVDDGLTVAAHMDNDLTEKQRQDIAEYIEFKKAQYRKEHEPTKE